MEFIKSMFKGLVYGAFRSAIDEGECEILDTYTESNGKYVCAEMKFYNLDHDEIKESLDYYFGGCIDDGDVYVDWLDEDTVKFWSVAIDEEN